MFSYSTQLFWMFLTIRPSYSVSVSIQKKENMNGILEIEIFFSVYEI